MLHVLSHLDLKVIEEHIHKMSRDSQVTSFPSGQWSCESLEKGIREAAKMAGIPLDLSKLSEAWGLDGGDLLHV
jgi:hypothetical protein